MKCRQDGEILYFQIESRFHSRTKQQSWLNMKWENSLNCRNRPTTVSRDETFLGFRQDIFFLSPLKLTHKQLRVSSNLSSRQTTLLVLSAFVSVTLQSQRRSYFNGNHFGLSVVSPRMWTQLVDVSALPFTLGRLGVTSLEPVTSLKSR